MTLAERLTELRVGKKASLQAVADAVGVSKPHIWELEKGKTKNPSLELLKELSIYYSVTLDSLVGLESKDEQNELSLMFREFDTSDLTDSDKATIKQAVNMAMALIKQGKQQTK
ncbi:XRE family transcriptional regulator [Marinomonas sp. CT5]|uniref:helix-turn-helix domain-containing protein n=1 Tax=unclassified Marinomonas TaxID=196814 RepID=UPI000C1E564A|nr:MULTISPECIES: helix-turn-helix transcriptional regulator [unclassified Marinomonas]PJE55527.1 hypothetical protein TY87_10475 [Marinomonas sp. BSi20584]QUX96667.1 XRE family transcriptional regulator [Marinomonas sp. CT5]